MCWPVNASSVAAFMVARTAQHAHTGHEEKPLRNGKYLAVCVSMGTAPVQVTFAFRQWRFFL